MQKKSLVSKPSPKKATTQKSKQAEALKARAASAKTLRLSVNHNQSLLRATL